VYSLDNLIKQVVELDKSKRVDLKRLEEEKAKLNSFFREERTRLQTKYQTEANKTLELRKKEIDDIISKAKINAKKDYEAKLKELIDTYNEQKKDWVESLYQYCISIEN
jgi:vacuolar-type H+-ATPase subunit E/Vma4